MRANSSYALHEIIVSGPILFRTRIGEEDTKAALSTNSAFAIKRFLSTIN